MNFDCKVCGLSKVTGTLEPEQVQVRTALQGPYCPNSSINGHFIALSRKNTKRTQLIKMTSTYAKVFLP